ncbi:hypothetical protein M413DRAFT_22601 [Hebeloma cylindrosporum]|uniref:RNA-dependent RNA polymerase n=1 Tax=Hebeloma cylindrosporum TaxID=76867 RepID=A0A0C3CV82_HEBCY|nr:hypothetical protein M413DRAFT_22601 [Hebeloma cylindrosporum h7]
MELFMRNIDWNIDKHAVIRQLANILHGPNFKDPSSALINFHVHLHPDRKHVRKHGGTGALTLPTVDIGTRFLDFYCSQPLTIGKKTISLSISKKPPRLDVVESIQLQPYIDPAILEQREKRAAQLSAGSISIKTIQFGWECRDYVFSIECEKDCPGTSSGRADLLFNEERRELRVKFRYQEETYFIAMNYSHIDSITMNKYLEIEHAMVFTLNTPPSYERDRASTRQRLSFLPIPDHERVAPYASLALRLVCKSAGDLGEFRKLSIAAQLHNRIFEHEYPVVRRNLFSQPALETLQLYLRRLNWCIAFQIESLVRSMVVDVTEILRLIPEIVRIIDLKGRSLAAKVLKTFSSRARSMWSEDEVEQTTQTVLQCFLDAEKEVLKYTTIQTVKPNEGSLCDTYHVIITPITMKLDGPSPDRSNRVIRAYETRHQESFLRVSFLDESKLHYRFDREVDGPEFIHTRVGPFLLDGLTIAGRKFDFLAYSQSALKEHSVWFVKPFRDRNKGYVDAKSIIESIGTFDNLQFDPKLIYCPARYAARLSQAFTATDSVEVEVEEIFQIEDIHTMDRKYQFTDGVGTLSKDLAREIWAQLKATKRQGRATSKGSPSAYQIRFMGSKGMLSVDHKLRGNAICLRPSMIKFEAPRSTNIEIARAFDRPGLYYLNRPLIMLLEGLGIPFDVFKSYQDMAVHETRIAALSLSRAAALFEGHGLGASYRLPSVMRSLEKLSIGSLSGNQFYEKMLEYAVNHILRLLKNNARIPVPGAWTLVGVADVNRYLNPGEIFACIKPVNGRTRYLEGRILISRSPTIHPGDVMVVNAIGRPPPGSCFDIEPLPNTVVFSVLGNRPVPSCLGGGDLDGDVYNLIPLGDLPEFEPKTLSPPANYDPAPKKLLDRPSTMADVAEFVMEYINSDVVPIIATNWLIIADREGIFADDCMKLANLHSNAVDYPKSGQPVALNSIPGLKSRVKPDWNAPETVDISSGNFYESTRAIGRLFRAIDLPIEQRRSERHPYKKRAQVQDRNQLESLEDALLNFNLADAREDYLFSVVEVHVQEFIDTNWTRDEDEVASVSQLFTRYASELHGICASSSLSHTRSALISEEEAIIGTIAQKSSQPRKRKDMMAKLREATDVLVRGIKEQLGEGAYLERAWMAWELSITQTQRKEFGAQSFGWIALGAIFDAIRELRESDDN